MWPFKRHHQRRRGETKEGAIKSTPFPIVVLDKPRQLRLDYPALRMAHNQFGLDITSGTLPPSVPACAVLIWAGCYYDTPRLSYRHVKNLVTAENLPALWEIITQALCHEAGVHYVPGKLNYSEVNS